MANLIDKDMLLKEWDKLPVQKVDYVDCGDAYRTRPLVDLARVCNMIKDAPTVTEAEIRAKAIEEFAEAVVAELENAFPINPYQNEFSNGRDYGIKKAISIVQGKE